MVIFEPLEGGQLKGKGIWPGGRHAGWGQAAAAKRWKLYQEDLGWVVEDLDKCGVLPD